jgi:NCS2 family nucleobase:cation symporter-2
MVSMTMIAAGIGSIIQASRTVGSGYLCPNLCGPSYLSVSLNAAWFGGIPLMRGMIIFSGLIEMLLAPVVKKLKFMFPPVVVGLVVAMVGVSVIPVGTGNLFGVAYSGDSIRITDLVIGGSSLLVMVGANIWGKGWLKMYCLLVGTIAGWLFALVLLPETRSELMMLHAKPFFELPAAPQPLWSIRFDPGMALTFIIISICGSLKSFGNLLAAQQISEPQLDEPDMRPIAKGLFADGFTTAMAGAIGALAVDTSSSNVGLAGATRAVSRWIAGVAGVLFTILAFMPKVTAALATIPRPVIGAAIIFAGSFMICTGLKEMLKHGLDSRDIFTVGVALFMGLSTGFLPEMYARFPQSLQTIFSEPLPTTTIFAVVLHQLFHADVYLTQWRQHQHK